MIPDCHAHLDLIKEDTESVVTSAKAAGVSPVITIGLNIRSSAEAVRAAAACEGVYAAVGIHPNDTGGATSDEIDHLEEMARASNRVVAIGETGLDYYRDKSPADAQKQAFRAQLRLAKRLGLPVIVHDREAHSDALALLAEELDGDVPVIMHCFSGDRHVLDECVRRDYYVSFAGQVTFKNAREVREMASLAPANRILCETDAPFLSPEPFRGKPNTPERVRFVAEALAASRGIALDDMERLLADNTSRVFGVPMEED